MIKLIISDFDGTIVKFPVEPFQSSWDAIGNILEGNKRKKWFECRDFYLDKIYKTEKKEEKIEIEKKWFQDEANLLAGEKIADLLNRIEIVYTSGVKEFFEEMKKRGKIIGILSSGLDFVIKKAVDEIGFDIIICSELEKKEGILTGKDITHIDLQNKVNLFQRICQEQGVEAHEVVYFGDHFNCIPCLKAAGLGIAVNAKTKEVKGAAKASIEDFRDAIKIIENYEGENHGT